MKGGGFASDGGVVTTCGVTSVHYAVGPSAEVDKGAERKWSIAAAASIAATADREDLSRDEAARA